MYALGAVLLLALSAPLLAAAHHPRVGLRVLDSGAAKVLRSGRIRVRVRAPVGMRVEIKANLPARPLTVRMRHRSQVVKLRLTPSGRRRVRAALARCRSLGVTVAAKAHGRRVARRRARLRAARGCSTRSVHIPGTPFGPARPASFSVGAAVGDFTPPAHGALPGDPADCAGALASVYSGPRPFAFEEPYRDLNGNGHYDQGEPYLDCNGNGRWEGNLLGGGSNTPRFYNHVADPVTARALVVSNGSRTIAVEVVDQEGLFNVYQDRIRQRVAADGYRLDGIFISATHDESAPDSLGLGGINSTTSGVNAYFTDYMVAKSASAIEAAYRSRRQATLRYSEVVEPANMRQCWSSYPFTDNQVMPVLQAVGGDGRTIATLASVSQHAETLGFNGDPNEVNWVSSDWPSFFRSALEARYGGVGIEMAGSVGSVESPQVFSAGISRTPQQFVDASHPAGCRTLFNAAGSEVPLGYAQETRAFGEQLAGAVESALGHATPSSSNAIYGDRSDICVPLTNTLFAAAATGGVFAVRPGYAGPGCSVQEPVAPNGTTSGNEVKSEVAAFRIGDGEFISLPGEVFPFTFLRGFQGPADMPNSQYPLPPWLVPHMRAPFRFVDGLAEDMIGYVFPRGNGVGVPGEDPSNPSANDTDRFGCGHSDDSEAASSQGGDIIGAALVGVLDRHDGGTETQVEGRYVLPDGSLSRDPLGSPEVKCNVDKTFNAKGPAIAVDLPHAGVVHPAAWMSLSGRPQTRPDRNTRGYFTSAGQRVWLDVFPDVTVP